MKFHVLDVLTSRRNVEERENDRTKYAVNIVKIPSIVISGPKERVATWLTEFPRTPMNVAEKRI